MQYEKIFDTTEQDILAKIKNNLQTKNFDIVNANDNSLRAERGSTGAMFYSSDIQKYKTILTVQFDKLSNKLTFLYDINIGGAFLGSNDQKKIDQELQEVLNNIPSVEEAQPLKANIENSSFKNSSLLGYTEKSAKNLLILALISLVIFPYAGVFAASGGILTLYESKKNHLSLSKKIILLNVLTIILGLISFSLAKLS